MDHPHVAAVLHVMEQLERILHDVFDQVGVVPATFVSDQVINAALQLRIDRRFVPFFHAREVNGLTVKCNFRAGQHLSAQPTHE